MTVRIVGVRHHSPACARLIGEIIAGERPDTVLIEGPADFNHRLDELTLAHRLPIAIYSYAQTDDGVAQCWYPFLAYSPEWVALTAARAAGATVRFIDLPHWHYRAPADTRRRAGVDDDGGRYAAVTAALCRRFHCDGVDALWDHVFEAAPAAALPARLDAYFDELRGDDAGSAEDQAREVFMARHIAASGGGKVLVICGGWHRPALERLWPTLPDKAEPVPPAPPDPMQAGSYLVPYEFRAVDALAGYGAGMQSPQFYQWCWDEGRTAAIDLALAAIVKRLRARRVAVSTAELVAVRHALAGLGGLRGHAPPTRVDLLDALQGTLVKEALERPAPWTARGVLTAADHPVVREALLALTGEATGKLHADTPRPPLLQDVEDRLARLDMVPARRPRTLVLDRREAADRERAQTLWRLKLLGVDGFVLAEIRAPRAARSLPAALRFEEHWTLVLGERWYAQLIEASAYGATLAHAAERVVLSALADSRGEAAALVTAMTDALRAGFSALGEQLGHELQALIPSLHDHGALAQAGAQLLELATTGFWGEDTRPLLCAPLVQLGERVLWLLDGHQAASAAGIEQDAQAVRFIDGLIRLDLAQVDRAFALDTLVRIAHRVGAPPALRGAALGAAYGLEALGEAAAAEVVAITRSIPPREALGDFLYGLFACARELATGETAIVEALHAAVDAMDVEDFLVALPQLRGAFGWFPPRERGVIAARVAGLLGLSQSARGTLLSLPAGPQGLVTAKAVETQALVWARDYGVLP